MRRPLDFLTSNWALKLIAFILATAVYFSMRDSIRSNRDGRDSNTSFMKGVYNENSGK